MMTDTQEAQPLQPPTAIGAVSPDDADNMVELDQETISNLDAKIAEYVQTVLDHDLRGEDFKHRVSDLHSMGNDEIREAASISNRMLDQPLRTINGGALDEDSGVSQALLKLRDQVEKLDPSSRGDLLSPRKLLGVIPLSGGIKRYFHQYHSAQTHINAVIEKLYLSRDELARDNAAIEEEKIHAWEAMQRLEELIYLARGLDDKLSQKVADLEQTDSEKARVIRSELIFYARQKVQDFLTQLAVTIQGYLAMDLVRKNNLELIKGIDRATTTTVSALRTAVMAAQALTNQRLVLDQVAALNKTTGDLIDSTADMLRQNATDVHQQATGTTIELDRLQRSFENIYKTMDMISNYKVEALANMQKTVELLNTEVNRAKRHMVLNSQEEPVNTSVSSKSNQRQGDLPS